MALCTPTWHLGVTHIPVHPNVAPWGAPCSPAPQRSTLGCSHPCRHRLPLGTPCSPQGQLPGDMGVLIHPRGTHSITAMEGTPSTPPMSPSEATTPTPCHPFHRLPPFTTQPQAPAPSGLIQGVAPNVPPTQTPRYLGVHDPGDRTGGLLLFFVLPPQLCHGRLALVQKPPKKKKRNKTPKRQEMPSHPPPQRRFLPTPPPFWGARGCHPLSPTPHAHPAALGCARVKVTAVAMGTRWASPARARRQIPL